MSPISIDSQYIINIINNNKCSESIYFHVNQNEIKLRSDIGKLFEIQKQILIENTDQEEATCDIIRMFFSKGKYAGEIDDEIARNLFIVGKKIKCQELIEPYMDYFDDREFSVDTIAEIYDDYKEIPKNNEIMNKVIKFTAKHFGEITLNNLKTICSDFDFFERILTHNNFNKTKNANIADLFVELISNDRQYLYLLKHVDVELFSDEAKSIIVDYYHPYFEHNEDAMNFAMFFKPSPKYSSLKKKSERKKTMYLWIWLIISVIFCIIISYCSIYQFRAISSNIIGTSAISSKSISNIEIKVLEMISFFRQETKRYTKYLQEKGVVIEELHKQLQEKDAIIKELRIQLSTKVDNISKLKTQPSYDFNSALNDSEINKTASNNEKRKIRWGILWFIIKILLLIFITISVISLLKYLIQISMKKWSIFVKKFRNPSTKKVQKK